MSRIQLTQSKENFDEAQALHSKFATNSECCEFHGEIAANWQSERICSKFPEVKSKSLRVCIHSTLECSENILLETPFALFSEVSIDV